MSKRRHASSSQLAHLASRLVALPRLFEPFYRVSEFCDHQTDGTGLGLSIAQRIAIIHDGSIRARNRDDGDALPSDLGSARPGGPEGGYVRHGTKLLHRLFVGQRTSAMVELVVVLVNVPIAAM